MQADAEKKMEELEKIIGVPWFDITVFRLPCVYIFKMKIIRTLILLYV